MNSLRVGLNIRAQLATSDTSANLCPDPKVPLSLQQNKQILRQVIHDPPSDNPANLYPCANVALAVRLNKPEITAA